MARWRTLASLVVVLTLAGSARAQTCSLVEAPLIGSHYRIQLSMSLTGELKVQRGDKLVSLKTLATANHQYLERFLDAGPDGGKSARLYQEARAAITIETDKQERSLCPDHTFIVAQRERGRDQVLAYCPKGPLSREELDITDHLDTYAVTGLLSGKDITVGDSWKVSNNTAQALCHLQGLSEHTLAGRLEQVKDDVAVFSVAGNANGIDQGASVKATVNAVCRFDLMQHRLIAVEWKQSEEREQGPVSPASRLTVVTQLKRMSIEPVNELSDIALLTWPVKEGPPPREMTDLHLQDARGRFALLHARDWQLVSRSDEHVVLRLLDRGEFVSQVTIAPWKKAEAGAHLPAEDFKTLMATSPGWDQAKLLKEPEEVKLPNGHWAYLVAAEGDLDGLRVVQYFYLLAGPAGDQAVLTFTMTPAQAQKLGSRDLELVRGLTLPAK